MSPSCRLEAGECSVPALHQRQSLFGEAGGSGQSKCPLPCVLSNKDERVWKEMEAESVRPLPVLPLARQDLICSSGEHSSSPRVSPGGEQGGSMQRGFARMPLCISCSEMSD